MDNIIETTTDFLDLINSTNSTSVLNEVNVTLVKQFASQTVRTQLRLYDVLIPTIGIISICLNLFVVISSGLILKKGQQPRSTYLFLGNVAMTDLVTAIAIIFGQLYPKQYRDLTICSLQIGMIVSSTLASVYSVGLIAIDRFLYITHGLHYQRWVYPLRARLAILFTWILGLVIGFLPAMGWCGDTNNGQYCWFILLAPKALIFVTVCFGAIPLLTVVVLYSIILYHALKNIISLQRARRNEAQVQYKSTDKGLNESSSTSQSGAEGLRIFQGRTKKDAAEKSSIETTESPSIISRIFKRKITKNVDNTETTQNAAAVTSAPAQGPSKWRAIKVVLFTSGSFVCTWGPYFIACILYTGCDKDTEGCKSLKILIASPLAILGFMNTLINPIIYAWWHKGFRAAVKKHWHSIRRRVRGRGREGTTSYTVPGKMQAGSSVPSKSTTSTGGDSETAISKDKDSKESSTKCDVR